ncbi:hypothetical protein ACOMHN_000534 [Nucella lapillus]
MTVLCFHGFYIACQTRDGDLEKFFMHENQPYPPSLSKLGELRSGKKADLLACLSQKQNLRGAPSSPHEIAAAAQDSIDDIIGSVDLEHVLDNMLADAEDDSFLFTDECFDGADHLGLEQMPKADISIISDVCSQGGTPTVDAKILDGAVIVQMLPPKLANTFQDYADVFLPYIMR